MLGGRRSGQNYAFKQTSDGALWPDGLIGRELRNLVVRPSEVPMRRAMAIYSVAGVMWRGGTIVSVSGVQTPLGLAGWPRFSR